MYYYKVNMAKKLIVIEGTDGSGKKTQTQLLVQRLQKEGRAVSTFSFPQYGKKSAGPTEEYLNGRYGAPGDVSSYAASIFYAVDRFDLSQEIKKQLSEGKIVISDRYVDSSAGHQGGKIADLNERKKYVDWLYDLEYRIFGIPKPDLVIILHLPTEIGQELIAKKPIRDYIENGKKKDIHEADIDHLKKAEESYLWLAKTYPTQHKIVECFRDGKILSLEEISELIYQVVKPILE